MQFNLTGLAGSNGIGAEGAGLLAAVLPRCPSLAHLNLRYNDIEDEGVGRCVRDATGYAVRRAMPVRNAMRRPGVPPALPHLASLRRTRRVDCAHCVDKSALLGVQARPVLWTVLLAWMEPTFA